MDHVDLLGATGGRLVVPLIVTIGLGVLNTVALYKIITKAGYSGSWILAPLSVIFLVVITVGVAIHAAVTLSSASLGTAGALLKLDYLDVFFNWVLFLVFAFSDWPALRRPSRLLPAPWGRAPAGTPWRGAPTGRSMGADPPTRLAACGETTRGRTSRSASSRPPRPNAKTAWRGSRGARRRSVTNRMNR